MSVRQRERRTALDAEPRSLDGVGVLVVEDDADARDLLERMLRYLGAFVVTAATVPDALAALRHFEPRVILTDIVMPQRDGMDFLRELLRTGCRHIPVIAITAFSDVLETEIALTGFDAVLRKPADIDALARTITDLVPRS